MEQEETGEEKEELRGMIDFFLLFFTEREAKIFKLRDEDMLAWETIGGIMNMPTATCRTVYYRMQDRIGSVRKIAKKFKRYKKIFGEFQAWANLSKEQRERVLEIRAKDILKEISGGGKK